MAYRGDSGGLVTLSPCIIAVHGLGANVDWSWTWKDPKDPSRHVKWLQDTNMLPSVVPESRVALYNYDSRWHADAPRTRLQLCGEDLIRSIRNFREGIADRPVVFVGHSLGGNVIQHGLLYAKSDDEFQHIVTWTAGVIFLGSPLRGSKFQPVSQALTLLLQPAGSHDGIVRELAPNDAALRDKLHEFCRMTNTHSLPVSCFFEMYEADYGKRVLRGVIKGMVVDEISACIDGANRIALQADHFMMNKFSNPHDRSFERVSQELRRMCKGAQAVVQQRIPNSDLSEQDTKFLADLRSTDPSDDKARIERTKGGLLRDSYRWILDHDDFRRWREDGDQSRLLWIKGDPGKGKTMLLCGIIDELEKTSAGTRTLSYFFCQATDVRLNNATAVLRGLIYQLLDQEPCLIGHVRKKYDHAGKQLFKDANSWDALSKMLISILKEPSLRHTYLIIDALDECEADLDQLLHLIVQVSTLSRVKLVVSSRNWPDIENALGDATQKIRFCLELNQESISAAVDKYIQYKVDQLVQRKRYDCKTRDVVQQHLVSNANNTFLWVALVCQELADPRVLKWHIRAKLQKFPPGLDSLYARMMDRVFSSDDADLCRQVLSLVSIAYRPLSLTELASLAESLEEYADDVNALEEMIGICGSLLTLREGVVYFVHQSAKDFLLKNESKRIYPQGVTQENHTIASRSIQVMSRTLRRDVYDLRAPGFPIDQVKPPKPDPLAPVQYSCIYWVNHLEVRDAVGKEQRGKSLQDSETVYTFLEQHYLHWLEALSLLRSVSEGILQLSKLAHLAQVSTETSKLAQLAWDGLRFIRTHRAGIESSPLQTYASALIFSPVHSFTRKLFHQEEPTWIVTKPTMEDKWNACLQTLEGHSGSVVSVAFSGDSTQLASASWDSTIKVWDNATGQCLQTQEGHCSSVNSVAFLGNSTQLASASCDGVVKVWDSATGQCLWTLEGHSDSVSSVVFSGDGKQLASATHDSCVPSQDNTIKVWDGATGQYLRTLKGHSDPITSVAFSGDNTQLASASRDHTVKVWDSVTGQCLQTLKGHRSTVRSVAFLGNSTQLASASNDNTVKVWDSATGQCLQTLEGHSRSVTSVTFSGDSTQLASASDDYTVKVWDNTVGQCLQTLQRHSDFIRSVAFSGDGTQLASASNDRTVKVWDSATGQCLQTLEGHCNQVNSVAFSGDGTQLASASNDRTVKVWEGATGQCLQTLEGHSRSVTSVTFSGDSTQLASASNDNTVKVWDSATGQCLWTLKGHSNPVTSVAFTGDSTQLASASCEGIIKVWDSATGLCLQTLEGHSRCVYSVVFSGDSTQLASASCDGIIKVWDSATIQCLRTLNIGRSLRYISFSKTDSHLLYTEIGVIDLERPPTSTVNTTASLPLTSAMETPRFHSYAISGDGMWITRNSVNLLWLPPEYRPTEHSAVSAVAGSTVGIGYASGRVLVFRFSEDAAGA
ncbi:vegetative incompatibility protein HET-E-1 [Colletotrichum spaethianum]|uniref:Vegetative incompatibility protein HET-E-1 n=1 Tax=Colletotrichum spaethianum TaxID=700344 RepID=A0AA37PDG9_9PEZI|nr:vegetative incompatibility protein HET-E-1 [Colletotrichum spaethianum]GKT50172.1 vegetative incompatibility protein HET-E-1 [Colletotrichum spaethianum]